MQWHDLRACIRIDDDGIVVVMSTSFEVELRLFEARVEESLNRLERSYIEMMCILSVAQIVVVTVILDALIRAR